MSTTKHPTAPTLAGPPLVRRETKTRIDISAIRADQTAAFYSVDRTPPEINLVTHSLEGQLDPRLVLLLDPDSERSASFRVLRHHILAAGRPQVIVVSSARRGEGKTTVALNLALALAECGRAKVALVEAHVRRPQLADLIGRPPAWCFGDQLLTHRTDPKQPWSLIDLATAGLHVAPLSPAIEKRQLLDGLAIAIAMEQLRLAGYDHIIIDTPPVLGSAEVNLMIDACDAVLLAVRARRSTQRDVQRAIDQLATPKLAGTVLLHA